MLLVAIGWKKNNEHLSHADVFSSHELNNQRQHISTHTHGRLIRKQQTARTSARNNTATETNIKNTMTRRNEHIHSQQYA